MKRILAIAIVLAMTMTSVVVFAGFSNKTVSVKGYVKKNGTVVAPYMRSTPKVASKTPTVKAPVVKTPAVKSPTTSGSVVSQFVTPKPSESVVSKFVTPKPDYKGYGAVSKETGKARTQWVKGYTKKNGSVVAGYWRS